MRVCLISTTPPSGNPRLVKEADALAEAGATVEVIGAHRVNWAAEGDPALLAARSWKCTVVDWRREINPALFWRSRLRHFGARKAGAIPGFGAVLDEAIISRIGSYLAGPASTVEADLFIAHNLGALPVALAAGRRCGVPVGFDAEDFHSGQLSPVHDAVLYRATRRIEQRQIPLCAYVTAASPLIAEAYRDLCRIPLPTCVLNVFPLRDRPPAMAVRETGPVRLHWFSQTIGANRGLEDAVLALGILKAHPLELHLRGDWWQNYERELRGLADRAGVPQERIIAHAPALADDLVRVSSAYDVGLALEPPVSVNNDILLPNKLFTYLLAGNAVLATRTRGQSALIPDLQSAAAWCDSGNPESLAAALRPWLERRAGLSNARAAAWDLGECRFNWDVEKSKFLAVVNRIAGRRFAGPARPRTASGVEYASADAR